jgi:chromatin segregation and condensation protein Rec8/ScpA/Scc1 (kleisin family)
MEVVVTFLALLELVKRYRVSAMQEGLFSDIQIAKLEEWKDDEELEIEFE